MGAVLTLDLERALRLDACDEESPPARPRGRVTLDDVIVSAWEGVATHHDVRCPVCGGTMAARYSAVSVPVGGRCRDCGATLG
jgi:tRNA(Ile2) C34 agmatinyltransferase TiaS